MCWMNTRTVFNDPASRIACNCIIDVCKVVRSTKSPPEAYEIPKSERNAWTNVRSYVARVSRDDQARPVAGQLQIPHARSIVSKCVYSGEMPRSGAVRRKMF
jgi:hypothetical protein